MGMTSLDEDLTILEELDFEIECVMCDQEAKWLVIFRCCGREAGVCDPCRSKERTIQMLWPKRSCKDCGYKWNANDEDNLEWVRI